MMKKDPSKKINPEYPQSIRNLEVVKPAHIDKSSQPSEKSSLKKNPGEVLPRIKVHSEPNERPNDRIAELLSKMR